MHSPNFTRAVNTVTILSQLENGLKFASSAISLTLRNGNMLFKIM